MPDSSLPQPATLDVLNRLLEILCRSFPMYASYARPWKRRGDERAAETFAHIVADQSALAARVNAAIVEFGAIPNEGRFPIEFTDLHDLSMDYLVREAIVCQQRDIASIEQCVDALRLAPAACELALEALGLAKGHLESLKEVEKQPA